MRERVFGAKNSRNPHDFMRVAVNSWIKKALEESIEKAAKFKAEKGFYTPPFFKIVPQYAEHLKNEAIKYFLMKGGRGSGKSFAACCHLIEESFLDKYKNAKFIFGREIQVSIEDSVYSLVKLLIQKRKLNKYFRITSRAIENKITGVKMLFKGFRATGGDTAFSQLNKIKGMTNVKYIFVDEAQDLTEETINVLFPTVNRGTSVHMIENEYFKIDEHDEFDADTRFIFAMNPNFNIDPIVGKLQSFINQEPANDDNYQPIAKIVHINIFDLPEEFQDKQLLEQARKEKGEIYFDHVWLGAAFHALSGMPFETLDLINTDQQMECIAFIDPSFNGGDFTAITFLGAQDNGRLAAWGSVFSQAWDVCIEELVTLIRKWRPTSVYYECNAIFGAAKTLFAQHGINAKPKLSTGNKHARIYRAASVVRPYLDLIENRSNRGYIKNVMTYSDKAKNDDAPDSLASACCQVVTQLKKAENQKWLKKVAKAA
ncbi:TPA: phage terminase large subunit [Vibrio cholerae]